MKVKKLLGIVLAIVMTFSMVPVIGGSDANADVQLVKNATKGKYYSSLQAAYAEADAGEELQLLSNIDLGNDALAIEKNLTLDLNGHTITGNSSSVGITSGYVIAANKGKLVLTDKSSEKGGTIENTNNSGSDSSWPRAVKCGSYVKVTGGVKLKSKSDYALVVVGGAGTAEIEDGIIESELSDAIINGGKLTVNGSNTKIKGGKYAISTFWGAAAETIIKGGSMSGESGAIQIRNGSLNISGGKLEGPYGIEVNDGGDYNPTTTFTKGSTSIIEATTKTFKWVKGGTVYINGGKFSDDEGNNDNYIRPEHASLKPVVEGDKTYYELIYDSEITLEFGEGHETLAEDFAAYMNGDESPLKGCDAVAEGSKVTFYFADREETVGNVQKGIRNYLMSCLEAPYEDNGDLLHFVYFIEEIPNFIGQKTMDKYSENKDVFAEIQESSKTAIPDKQTFYVLWDKPVKNVSMSVKPPVCGVETKVNDDETQTNPPQVTITVKGCSFVSDEMGEKDSEWFKSDCSEYFSGIFKGGNEYGVRSFLTADFGYYFPDDAKCSIENGSVISPKELPDNPDNPAIYAKSWMSVYYRVKAVHDPAASIKEKEVKATCTKDGSYDEVAYCKACKEEVSRERKTVKATGHKWGKWKVTKKATTKAKGLKQRTCANCGEVQKKAIPKLKKPTGVLMAKMTAKGKNALKVRWSKTKNAAGYVIFMNKCNYKNKIHKVKRVKTVKGNKTFMWVAKELEENTCYKLYVRAYKKVNGKKKYLKRSPLIHAITGNYRKPFTNVKSIKVKKKNVSLEKGKSFRIKAKLRKKMAEKSLLAAHAPKLRYCSSNENVATVTAKGKIKAVASGKAYIYVFAHNGVSKTVKVKVK